MKTDIFLLSLKIFGSWILLLLFFILAGGILFGDLGTIDLLDFANWDGRHFLEIAKSGYTSNEQYAFFPLYPLLIDFFAGLLNIDVLYSAFIINLFSVFGSIYLFLKLAENNGKGGVKAVFFFLIFPTSFYLISIYSESLFLLFSLLTFFFAEKRKIFLAAIFASLSLLTRITGIAILVSLLFYLNKAALKEKFAVFLISVSGFCLYCLFLFLKTGNPFYFLVAEQSWGRSLSIPGYNILDSITYLVISGAKPESFTILSDLVFTVFGLGVGIRSLKVLKPPLALYTIISVLIPLSTGLLLSIPRFLAVVFPVFLVVSRVNNRIFSVSYFIISIVLLFLYFNFFLRNIWVS